MSNVTNILIPLNYGDKLLKIMIGVLETLELVGLLDAPTATHAKNIYYLYTYSELFSSLGIALRTYTAAIV